MSEHDVFENLPPPFLLLTVDPPLKQYIIHLHTLIREKKAPSSKSKSYALWRKTRQTILREWLRANGDTWKELDEVLRDEYGHVAKGYDAIIDDPDPDNHPECLPNVFDFVIHTVESSDYHIGVIPGIAGGLHQIIKDWSDENVWNKDDEEDAKEAKTKTGKKRGRKKGS